MTPSKPAVVPVDFDREPSSYKHWALTFDGPVATLTMQVQPDGGLRDDYELKLNSYDLGVDIELYDAVQRLRFEHPEVHAVVVTGGHREGVLRRRQHPDARDRRATTTRSTSASSPTRRATPSRTRPSTPARCGSPRSTGPRPAVATSSRSRATRSSSSTTARSAVSLPEVPLLAVLPGTGGLTRLVDKRHVRRDLADVFATRTEGVRGQQALRVGARRRASRRAAAFDEVVADRAVGARRDIRSAGRRAGRRAHAARRATVTADGLRTRTSTCASTVRSAPRTLVIAGRRRRSRRRPTSCTRPAPTRGCSRAAASSTTPILRSSLQRARGRHVGAAHRGRPRLPSSRPTDAAPRPWGPLARARGPALLDPHAASGSRSRRARSLSPSSRPGSCFAGTLAELVLVADRAFMLDGTLEDDRPIRPATLQLTDANDGWYPMSNGLSRLATTVLAAATTTSPTARAQIGKELDAADALDAGLVTFTPDDIDWEDEVRVDARGAQQLLARRADRAWRRTSASPAPRRWRRRSSPACQRGRTGSSSGPMRPVPRVHCSASVPGTPSFDRART